MPKQMDHFDNEWAKNTLHRTGIVGQNVYQRAAARKVEWPEFKPINSSPRIEDSPSYTSVDDAFSTVLQFMSQTSRQCKKYYDTQKKPVNDSCDIQHCSRFHHPEYSAIQYKNPLQRTEDVHVVVQPGTYSVTAGSWGKQQKHVVHVNEGQSVELDFCI